MNIKIQPDITNLKSTNVLTEIIDKTKRLDLCQFIF